MSLTETTLTTIRDFLRRCGLAEFTPVRREQMERFRQDLLATNEDMNLTRITGEEEFWCKHVLDSLALGLVMPDLLLAPRRVADVGCGAGFPLVPLAWANPDLCLTGIETNLKKGAFIAQECIRLNLGNCQILGRQAREAGLLPEHHRAYDLVTCRAVSRPDRLIRECRQLLKADSQARLVLYSTPAAITEQSPLLQREAVKYRLTLGISERIVLPAASGDRQFVLLAPAIRE